MAQDLGNLLSSSNLNFHNMTKSIYNSLGIHQFLKLHGTHSLGFESCRRVLVVFMMATVSVLTSLAQTPLTEEYVLNRIMERKDMEGYTEGTPWTNDIPYSFDEPYSNHVVFDGWPVGWYGGVGCFGFMMDMMEYASNYEYPIRIINGSYDDLPKIRIGDGVRVNNDTHSVFVIGVDDDGHTITVAEGNFNSSVHWGRRIDLSDSKAGFTNLATFWPAEPVNVTISQYGYATFFYSNSAYVIPEGVEAKVVENISGKSINLLPLSGIIPKDCAVILKGKPGKYTFEPTSQKGTVSENMLRGTNNQKMIKQEEQNCKYYKLTVKNDKVGFYYGEEDGALFVNEAHKAYLPVPVSQSQGINCFTFDTTTSIYNIQAADEDRAIYNLSGQRVSDSYKGVVIINGKKILRK